MLSSAQFVHAKIWMIPAPQKPKIKTRFRGDEEACPLAVCQGLVAPVAVAGFPARHGGTPSSLDGVFHGKSHLEMDGDWG